ncbi:hypothetical protein I6N90_20625 [Paenibacillus sp. GSMTC-2017]|uniref:hypothetical protein n=1 Tax=Paenibacillus sp. GSMTC-2017 TaxID=2794350 RepID=UPI0018D61431|nr:hypothetical protein [Paenibacillus sp. GSMTC-2017]MBH5320215.1 hypothetical protein [Paenibacillus sp. GSMTC-2017]
MKRSKKGATYRRFGFFRKAYKIETSSYTNEEDYIPTDSISSRGMDLLKKDAIVFYYALCH